MTDDRLYAIFENEFARQPYCGVLQFYLVFECKTANSEILARTMRNSTDQDMRAYLSSDENLLNDDIDFEFITRLKDQIVEDEVDELIDEFIHKISTLRDEVKEKYEERNLEFLKAVAFKDLPTVQAMA